MTFLDSIFPSFGPKPKPKPKPVTDSVKWEAITALMTINRLCTKWRDAPIGVPGEVDSYEIIHSVIAIATEALEYE